MGKKYRPNVAAILVNREGKILVAERINIPGSWQFPQGGIDNGETPRAALLREVEEELSLPPSSYNIVIERGGYRYDFPPDFDRWKKYRGQEQTYFLCEFEGPDELIDLNTAHPEFSTWKWITPREFDLDGMIGFKREVYAKVLRDFFEI